MYKIQDIYDCIQTFAPFERAMSFDNAGLLCGSLTDSVSGVLLSLDITPTVISQAAEMKANLIVSHHPVIFSPLRRLEPGSTPWMLVRQGIGAVCAHTNLDVADTGVNLALADAIGLADSQPFCPEDPEMFGRCGTVTPVFSEQFSRLVKQRLRSNHLRFTVGRGQIRRVVVAGGAGGELWSRALSEGFDALVTGEAKYHQFLEADAAGFSLIEAGHFATETPVLSLLARTLSAAFPDLPISLSRQEDPARSLK